MELELDQFMEVYHGMLVKLTRKMEPQLSSLSTSGRSLHNTLSSERRRKKRHPHGHLAEVGEDGRLEDEVGREVLRLEAELLQQQHKERRDRQHQPTGEVGDEEHKLPADEIVEGRGADMDPSGECRRTPSKQVAHQVECHLRLEALGRV
jgi:predicted extracellular nuclease